VQFIEGSVEQIDRFCARLQPRLGVARPNCSTMNRPLPAEPRAAIDALKDLEPYYRVWGGYEGRGVVIRSEEPVDFYPDGRVVNVVPVKDLKDALRYVNVATQTVGVFPTQRKSGLRDLLASAGVQRVVELGNAMRIEAGLPHDGFLPLSRFVRWLNDE
jgi:hypothetical protein